MHGTNLDDLRAHVALLRWAKARKAEIKEIEDNARHAVEQAMGNSDLGLIDGKPAIAWKSHKQRRLDQKALKAAHPDLVDSYTMSSEVRRFEVIDDE